jgi:hypothetical protein
MEDMSMSYWTDLQIRKMKVGVDKPVGQLLKCDRMGKEEESPYADMTAHFPGWCTSDLRIKEVCLWLLIALICSQKWAIAVLNTQ